MQLGLVKGRFGFYEIHKLDESMRPIYLISVFFLFTSWMGCTPESIPEIPKSSAKELSNPSISVANATFTYEESTNTYTYTVPENTDVKSIAFVFTLSQGAVSVPASGSVQDFTNPVKYTITAEDGSTKVVTVVVKILVRIANCKVISSGTITNGVTNGICYQYVYNQKNQLVYYERYGEGFRATFNLEYYTEFPELLRQKRVNINNGTATEERYEYNSDKKLVSRIFVNYSKDGLETSRQEEHYRYDSKGKISRIEIDFPQSLSKYGGSVIYEYTDGILTNVNAVNANVTVDSKGNITRFQLRNSPFYTIYTYNDKGLVVERRDFNGEDKLFSIRKFEYAELQFVPNLFERLQNQESYAVFNLSADESANIAFISSQSSITYNESGGETSVYNLKNTYEQKNGEISAVRSESVYKGSSGEFPFLRIDFFTVTCTN